MGEAWEQALFWTTVYSAEHDYICVCSLDIIQVTNTHILYYIILYYVYFTSWGII